jgi:hypothetical protein
MIATITTIGVILAMTDTVHHIITHITPITNIIHTVPIKKEEVHMYYRYQPYPYYRRHYNLEPYYRRYYTPYYNYMQNIVNSQIANSDQDIVNYGDMTDVIQDSDIYQSMTPPEDPLV